MEQFNKTLNMTLEEIKEDLRKRILDAHAMASMDNGYPRVGPQLGSVLDGLAESIYAQNQIILSMMGNLPR